MRNLLLNNKALRLELAIELFRADEVSLGRAAEIAGIDRWEFQDVPHERHIPITIEAESAEAMNKDIARFLVSAKRQNDGRQNKYQLTKDLICNRSVTGVRNCCGARPEQTI